MKNYRKLNPQEIEQLKAQMCTAADWDQVEVSADFSADHVRSARFSGNVKIGAFSKEFVLPGGMVKHSGLYHVTLHNVVVGDDCCIENVKNYIANYVIGDGSFIENVDIILTDGETSFGNGVEVAVLNETGGREVLIYDRLTAQTAYVMALYRHRPEMIAKLRESVDRYVAGVTSSVGYIGKNVVIVDSGYIKNVKIGDYCKIEGTSRLKNGSINSNEAAPVHLGVNVIGDDFIISSGSSVEDGVTFSRCFIGQACKLGHNYSATDSLFFSNCQGENGEACAIFAGPYTVTHHKSTLLIAGMFSFMNAGSGSNQSNHMYKLGPIHQGIMERGAKTSSDSYILWPSKVGAFSLVMGRHVSHQDTSNLPFAYLIEQQNTSFIMPGANLKSVGTIRDAKKWPGRDGRKDPDKLDQVNYNLLSPYTIQKMLNGIEILKNLQKVSGPNSAYGEGDWVDISGMIAPKKAVFAVLDDIESGALSEIEDINARFAAIHAEYYNYEWRWAYRIIREYYGVDLSVVTADKLRELVSKWQESVVALDNMIYDDARKEFSLNAMTSFGADGDEAQRKEDFMQVRGSFFEADPFVMSVKEHIRVKSQLGDRVLEILHRL